MIRITKDNHFNYWYIHKKFLFWWIKLGYPKSNMSSDINHIYRILKYGTLNFNLGEYGNYYYIIDKGHYSLEYFKNVNDFEQKYAEYLI